ncbi:hypothetical protein RSOL_461540 [Rhizoctonia solani AG-3 Rhs1AP]|uniref:Uncharacterized protein n=2 Tax=Rhizoctonia solani AG-3 TaxID=1086053 RepID=A0A074SCY3_9AGAM|nr:hypothetical protein RSOL_461540 [Rhizoctonia solani AG-3 Rhs1AP]KEP47902.1 hypothetical protein V565_140130 [Rhizoctonia solani 123E]
MPTSRPEIASHELFRPLSQDFFKPYPPYILVNSQEDANSVLSAGCEPGYLLVLNTSSLPGTKSLQSDDIKGFRGRVGIVIWALPFEVDLSIVASQVLESLEVDGTAIGFATAEQSTQWKRACLEWAKAQKTEDAQGGEKDGITIEWSSKDVKGEKWVQWSVVKKAPEWAFC